MLMCLYFSLFCNDTCLSQFNTTNINSNVSWTYARAESQECEHPHLRQYSRLYMATLHASLFISLGGVSDRTLKRGCSLWTGGLHCQRQSPAPYRLPKEDVWVMTKGHDRAWDWAETVLLRHQDGYFPARAPVKSLRGWVSSHLYPRFTFKKPKALMNCTFQENQKTNILWKLSQKRWCHIWCMKMDSQIHSKSWITEDHIRRWPWKASFARLCWIYNHLS